MSDFVQLTPSELENVVIDEPQVQKGEKSPLANIAKNKIQPVDDIFFKQTQPQCEALTEYLQSVVGDSMQCLNCQNYSTHCLVWIGAFVCKPCSKIHQHILGWSQSKMYVKDIFNEQWDDYQLVSIQIGGNQKLKDYMKEYEIENLAFVDKYTHEAVQWYKQRHQFMMFGGKEEDFNVRPPPKTIEDRLEQTITKIQQEAEPLINDAIKKVEEKANEFEIKDKVAQMKEKYKNSSFATKLQEKQEEAKNSQFVINFKNKIQELEESDVLLSARTKTDEIKLKTQQKKAQLSQEMKEKSDELSKKSEEISQKMAEKMKKLMNQQDDEEALSQYRF